MEEVTGSLRQNATLENREKLGGIKLNEIVAVADAIGDEGADGRKNRIITPQDRGHPQQVVKRHLRESTKISRVDACHHHQPILRTFSVASVDVRTKFSTEHRGKESSDLVCVGRFLVGEYFTVFEIKLLWSASFQSAIDDCRSQLGGGPRARKRHGVQATIGHPEHYLANRSCGRATFGIRVGLALNLVSAPKSGHHHGRGLLCPHCPVLKGTHARHWMATPNAEQGPKEAGVPGPRQLFIEASQAAVALPAYYIQQRRVASECAKPTREPVFVATGFVRAVDAGRQLRNLQSREQSVESQPEGTTIWRVVTSARRSTQDASETRRARRTSKHWRGNSRKGRNTSSTNRRRHLSGTCDAKRPKARAPTPSATDEGDEDPLRHNRTAAADAAQAPCGVAGTRRREGVHHRNHRQRARADGRGAEERPERAERGRGRARPPPPSQRSRTPVRPPARLGVAIAHAVALDARQILAQLGVLSPQLFAMRLSRGSRSRWDATGSGSTTAYLS